MLELATLFLFPALMAYAAASDLLTMTIANWVSLALVGAFVVLAPLAGMPAWDLLTDHLACGFAVLAFTFALFAFGWIGGGDAKLAAATAVWLGWHQLYEYGLQSSLLGGALTLGILLVRRCGLPYRLLRYGWVQRLHDSDSGIPYGIALAVAGLALYPDTAVWTAAAAA